MWVAVVTELVVPPAFVSTALMLKGSVSTAGVSTLRERTVEWLYESVAMQRMFTIVSLGNTVNR